MATDFRVVTPDDLGQTLKLNAKTQNKYDVDITQLDLPAGIDSFELAGTVLTAKTNKGDKQIDLAPMLPKVVADTFLKGVEKQGNKLVFTIGKKDGGVDTTVQVDVADLLPVVADNTTITGTGIAGNPLKVSISNTGTNLLKDSGAGLGVGTADVEAIVRRVAVTPARDVRLVNATGQTVLGYLHSTEQ